MVTPEPTSIENTYRFLKSAFYRRLRQCVSSYPVKNLIDAVADQKNEMGIRNPQELIEAATADQQRGCGQDCPVKWKPFVPI